jgi:hypothetical protein
MESKNSMKSESKMYQDWSQNPELTKVQFAKWTKAEAEYYADAEYWKGVQERMIKKQEAQLVEWKRQDEKYAKMSGAWDKIEKDQAEMKKYTAAEINEAIHQIRIDRLKNILEPYVQ